MSGNKDKLKNQIKQRRKSRVKAKVSGTSIRPRLSIFRSLKHIRAQLVDDQMGKTLTYANDSEVNDSKSAKVDIAFKVGELIAQKAKKLGIKNVVFDKSSYKYHGRVKSVADGARKGGLEF